MDKPDDINSDSVANVNASKIIEEEVQKEKEIEMVDLDEKGEEKHRKKDKKKKSDREKV